MGDPRQAFETRQRGGIELVAVIEEVAAQDQQALAKLYDATRSLVYGLVLRILADHSVAEEVLIDVYMQAWRQASRYREERGSPIAWLTTIARSRALDRLRSSTQEQRRSQPLEFLDKQAVSGSSPDTVLALETRAFVKRALDALSPEQQEVIELAYYGGLSQSEIALKLNQPLGTVKTRTRLGMVKLREQLGPLVAEGQI